MFVYRRLVSYQFQGEVYMENKRRTTKAANGDTIRLCSSCDMELATIVIPVDGNNLLMESCDKCDKRSWQLAGEQINLEHVLSEVKSHVGKGN